MKRLWVCLLVLVGFTARGTELEGRWLSECLEAGVDGAREERVFQGGRFTEAFVSFTDSDCKNLYRGVLFEGTFELGDRSALAPGARDIDLHYEKEFLVMYHPDWVTYYNEEKMCGIDDWKVGVTREVTGTDCQTAYGKFPSSIYNVYLKLKDRLVVGDLTADTAFSGKSPEMRPRAWDDYYVLFWKPAGGE